MKKTNFVLYFRVKWKLPLIRFDMTFATYYAKKRGEGKPHRVAITHVAKKLIRVIYALERQDIDFNAQKLRQSSRLILISPIWNTMYSDGLLKLPIFTIQKNFKILLTVYSLSPPCLFSFTLSPPESHALKWQISRSLKRKFPNVTFRQHSIFSSWNL